MINQEDFLNDWVLLKLWAKRLILVLFYLVSSYFVYKRGYNQGGMDVMQSVLSTMQQQQAQTPPNPDNFN